MSGAAVRLAEVADGGLRLSRAGDWLIARFAAPQRLASWAIVGGGLTRGAAVAWLRVGDDDLRPPIDPGELLRARLAAAGVPDAVGLLTSCDLDAHVDRTHRWAEHRARCIVTVGLGNALRAGDPPGVAGRIGRVGTINLLCQVSTPLSDPALLEALAIAVEARTLAVREAEVPSRRSGAPASGTGTDCVVIAAPSGGGGARYAGKHTAIGHLIGAAVLDATAAAVAGWQRAAARRAAEVAP